MSPFWFYSPASVLFQQIQSKHAYWNVSTDNLSQPSPVSAHIHQGAPSSAVHYLILIQSLVQNAKLLSALPGIQWEETCKVVHTKQRDWKLRLHQSTTLELDPVRWWIFFGCSGSHSMEHCGKSFPQEPLHSTVNPALEVCCLHSTADISPFVHNNVDKTKIPLCCPLKQKVIQLLTSCYS